MSQDDLMYEFPCISYDDSSDGLTMGSSVGWSELCGVIENTSGVRLKVARHPPRHVTCFFLVNICLVNGRGGPRLTSPMIPP